MNHIKVTDLKKYVETCTGIVDISSKDKTRPYAHARALYYKLARDYTPESFNTIGKLLGKNHATVMHGINKIFKEALMYEDDIIEYYNKFKVVKDKYLTNEQLRAENEILLIKLKILENKLGL